MSSEFKKGDLVRLKSGGPQMTVDNIAPRSMMGESGEIGVWCVWFDKGKEMSSVFGPHVLVLDE